VAGQSYKRELKNQKSEPGLFIFSELGNLVRDRNPNEPDRWMGHVGSSQPPEIFNGVEVTCTTGESQNFANPPGKFDRGLK